MGANVRYRDPQLESRERERFRVLHAVYTAAAADSTSELLAARVADRLGLLRIEAAHLIDELVRAGFLAASEAGPSVSLTPLGVEYIERNAGRRRSIRMRARRAAGPGSCRPTLIQRILGRASQGALDPGGAV